VRVVGQGVQEQVGRGQPRQVPLLRHEGRKEDPSRIDAALARFAQQVVGRLRIGLIQP